MGALFFAVKEEEMIETVASADMLIDEVMRVKKNRLAPDFATGKEKRKMINMQKRCFFENFCMLLWRILLYINKRQRSEHHVAYIWNCN